MKNFFNLFLFKKSNKTLIQFFRYAFVGLVATLVDMETLFLLAKKMEIQYLLSAAVAFVFGLLTNYILSILWVFESSKKITREFFLFSIIGIGGLLWTEIILWTMVDGIGLPLMLSKITAVILVLTWNFSMRKKFVFNRVKNENGPIE